jgi:nucleotide-binding universal stress UspA family protein
MTHRILVPFELPDADPISPVLVQDLSGMEIVALGHFNLPEQTPPDAGRAQFGEEVEAELDELVAPFREAGTEVTTRLVFGKDRAQTIDRIAIEEGCDAELDPAPTEDIERILVPLVDTENLDRLEDFVGSIMEENTWEVTLFHVAEQAFSADEDPDRMESMLDGARETMIDDGFDHDMVDVSVVVSENHDEEILTKADEYDAVVMGEADPDIRERIFGTLPDRIADRTGDPVIIVRRNI